MVESNMLRGLTSGAPREIVLDYAPATLQQILSAVVNGFEHASGAPAETVGVLFGTRRRGRIIIEAVRKVEHSREPGALFQPNDANLREFDRVLHLCGTQVRLRGLIPVGWFVSHARDSLVLRPSDREVYDRYFQEDWQVTVVVRPGPVGSVRVVTYGRGGLETEVKMLNVLKLGGSRDSVEPELSATPTVETRSSEAALAAALSGNVPDVVPAAAIPARIVSPKVRRAPAASAGRKWRVALVIAFVLLTLGVAGKFYFESVAAHSMFLQAAERSGVLQIEWDGGARQLAQARSGKLEIIDGDQKGTYPLTQEELRKGAFAIIRKNADITAKLVYVDVLGNTREEQTRYLGKAVELKPDEHVQKILEMEREMDQLRAEARKERDRAAELQSWVDVLESTMKKREGRR